MWKSKLQTKYKAADPDQYLIGADHRELDPIFSKRLAYAAKDTNIRLHITEGYRSIERQAELYQQYLDYKKTGKGVVKLAAKPGTSRHEYRLAVDTSTQPIRGMLNNQLTKYGLCKPIASEPWHIEPIELLNLNIAQIKAKYLPEEEVEEMTTAETEKLINKILDDRLKGADTKPSDWAKKELAEAVEAGITDGTRPKGVATREEVAVMIVRSGK